MSVSLFGKQCQLSLQASWADTSTLWCVCFRPDVEMSRSAVPCHVSATPAGPCANSPWETSHRLELVSAAPVRHWTRLQWAARPASAAQWRRTAQKLGRPYSHCCFTAVCYDRWLVFRCILFRVTKPLSAAVVEGHLHWPHWGSARGQRSEHPDRGRRSTPPCKTPRCCLNVRPLRRCFSVGDKNNVSAKSLKTLPDLHSSS